MNADKTTSDSESEETKPKPFPTIDLFHRVSCSYQKPEKMDHGEFNSGIDCIVTRAESILSLVSDQFARDDGDDGGKLNDTILYYSLQSVEMDLKDIRVLVEAFVKAEKAAQS